MRRLRLREGPVRLRLGRMDQVGELDGVLDEEHRDVVADEVPVALLRVESSPRSRARRGRGQSEPLLPATVEKRTKAGVFSPARWKMSARVILRRATRRSRSSRGRRSRAHARRARECARGRSGRSSRGSGSPPAATDPRSAVALEGVLVVGDRSALCRRQHRRVASGDLVKFVAVSAHQRLVVDGHARGACLPGFPGHRGALQTMPCDRCRRAPRQ
jgi:hypothetical protein